MSENQTTGRFSLEGRFVWHELHTSDTAAAEEYYRELFGWRFSEPEEELRGYHRTIRHGSSRVGFLVELDGEVSPSSLWVPFLTVGDTDDVVTNIERLGGRLVTRPSEQQGMGTKAIVSDGSGGIVGVMSGVDSRETVDDALPLPGAILWNDLISLQPQEAGKFYCGLVGLQLYSMDLGDEGTYYLLRRGEVNEAGILLKPEKAEGGSAWLSYVVVEKIDEACVKAAHIGGAIHIPPRDLHGAGRYAVIGDTTGAVIALFEPAVQR